MGAASAIALFLVLWALIFLVALPIRVQTQGEAGKVVPGTNPGSPERHNIRQKLWITTAVAVVLWALVATLIWTGALTVRDLDVFNRMRPPATVTD